VFAGRALKTYWSTLFADSGRRFDKPRVSFYGIRKIPPPALTPFSRVDWMEELRLDMKSIHSLLLAPPACELALNNAFYCPAENAIYYDLIFLTQLAKAVGGTLGTTGVYAAVTVLAHEMGHAVDYQAGKGPADLLFLSEANADCFAGAAIAELVRIKAGSSRAAQLIALNGPERSEGPLALCYIGGDEISTQMHPPRDVRVDIFTKGYDKGASVCAFGKVSAR